MIITLIKLEDDLNDYWITIFQEIFLNELSKYPQSNMITASIQRFFCTCLLQNQLHCKKLLSHILFFNQLIKVLYHSNFKILFPYRIVSQFNFPVFLESSKKNGEMYRETSDNIAEFISNLQSYATLIIFNDLYNNLNKNQ